MNVDTIDDFLTHAIALVESDLDARLPRADEPPQRLHEAMRYSVLAGGKRVRPALVLAACRAAGGADDACLPAMSAVELLHTYTLVHDDLPAMDDDDLRRGRPTCHRAFGEGTAILVGDALLTLAMEVLAGIDAKSVACLARAAGSRGTVGGQQDDLDGEGETVDDSPLCRQRLERIHRGKTAALIRASCELGALAAGADAALRRRLAAYGEAVGLAFQVVDDILDATASAEMLGKTPGKDAVAGKFTYVAVHGLESARAEAERLSTEAAELLAPLGERGSDLATLATYIIDRRS